MLVLASLASACISFGQAEFQAWEIAVVNQSGSGYVARVENGPAYGYFPVPAGSTVPVQVFYDEGPGPYDHVSVMTVGCDGVVARVATGFDHGSTVTIADDASVSVQQDRQTPPSTDRDIPAPAWDGLCEVSAAKMLPATPSPH